MRIEIVNFIKYTKVVYFFYFYIVSLFFKFIKFFIKTDNHLILFNSFGGRKFDDSPKEIFNCMLNDPRFAAFRFVWAFYEPNRFDISEAKLVKIDTFQYFMTALKARVWITNSSIERGLNFKGKSTFYFNTWHGTPLKKMGNDISSKNLSFHSSYGRFGIDVMTVQSDFEIEIFSRAFRLQKNHFLKCGLPRNDKLAQYSFTYRTELREKLSIPYSKKVILYAPTFREFEKDKKKGCIFASPFNLEKWATELGNDYLLLFRVHYEVIKLFNMKESSFVKDVTNYEALSDLMIVSDILISDYSSIYFDYSIMDKPMFYFTYDYDKYLEERGMYFDIREYISGSNNEDDLLNLIKTIDLKIEIEKTRKFRDKYVKYYGYATKMSIDSLAHALGL